MEDKDNIRQLVEKYLNNEASLYERARIDTWIEEDEQLNGWLAERMENTSPVLDPDLRERFNARLVDLYATTDDAPGITAAGHPDDDGILRRRLRIWRWSMAASIIVITLLSAILIYDHSAGITEQPVTVCTNAGERSHVTLPDGSTLTLNHLSKIKYYYDSNRRERSLELSGEAAFDIESDPEHPFIVTCDGLRIQCLGTSFNVKGYSDERNVTVVLSDGAIIASTPHQAITMKPGTKVNFDKNTHSLESTKVDASDYTDWTAGTDRFNDDCFEDVLHAVSRRYGVEISLLTPSLRKVRLTGSIGRKSLDETLNIIASASDTKYIMESDSTICFYREP